MKRSAFLGLVPAVLALLGLGSLMKPAKAAPEWMDCLGAHYKQEISGSYFAGDRHLLVVVPEGKPTHYFPLRLIGNHAV